uniref:50S ribosomal protein L35 n=1 Tax=Spongospora subterranea TaxID=70186 RepID=A0A0H5R8K5_9EUKA|eukprot:CRZ04688.1 hypothetical protein [Spongospora subterranea]
MPPFAPPYGILATAVFHVISCANAFTSSGSTSGWYLIPPFIGPRALSCCTLNPTNDANVPSSFGIVHSTLISLKGISRLCSNFESKPRSLAASLKFLLVAAKAFMISPKRVPKNYPKITKLRRKKYQNQSKIRFLTRKKGSIKKYLYLIFS